MHPVSLVKLLVGSLEERRVLLAAAVDDAVFLAREAPERLVEWLLWAIAERNDLWQMVELPVSAARDYLAGKLDGTSLAERLDGTSYPLSAALAGFQLSDIERANAVIAAVAAAASISGRQPKLVANLAVGAVLDLQISDAYWAERVVHLRRLVEQTQLELSSTECSIHGCDEPAVFGRLCRGHDDARRASRLQDLEAGLQVRFSVGDALAFERMGRLDPNELAEEVREVETGSVASATVG